MCYSTLVLDDAYAAVPGVEYYVVETAMGTFRFAQSSQGAGQGVLPALLDDLAAFRKKAKKDMAAAKAAGDAWAEALANGRQLAFKVTMNSAYGTRVAGSPGRRSDCVVPIVAAIPRRLLRRHQGHAAVRAHRRLRHRHRPGHDPEDQGPGRGPRARQPRGVW